MRRSSVRNDAQDNRRARLSDHLYANGEALRIDCLRIVQTRTHARLLSAAKSDRVLPPTSSFSVFNAASRFCI